VIGYGIALTAFGTTVGAIYPRLLAMETTVAKIQEAQDNTVRSVERLAVIVERMDKGR
jgi:hypothetical protein